MKKTSAHGFMPFDAELLTKHFGDEFSSWLTAEAEKWELPVVIAQSDKQVCATYRQTKEGIANETVE
jgi:hypothetical protein